MVVTTRLPVVTDLAHRLRKRVVIREHRPALAIAAERLAREEAGGPNG
jgi:hypothetical protein